MSGGHARVSYAIGPIRFRYATSATVSAHIAGAHTATLTRSLTCDQPWVGAVRRDGAAGTWVPGGRVTATCESLRRL